MSVHNSSRSFYKSKNISNCETTKTTPVNENTRENIGSVSNNYFSISNLSSIHSTDSAGSKPLRQNNFLLNASTSKHSDNDSYNSFQKHLTSNLAYSSPLFQTCNAKDNHFDGYLAERNNTCYTYPPAYEPSYSLHGPCNKSRFLTEYQEHQQQVCSALNTSKPLSGTFFNNVTNVLNPNRRSAGRSQKSSEKIRNDAAPTDSSSCRVSSDSTANENKKCIEPFNGHRGEVSSSSVDSSRSTANSRSGGETTTTAFADGLRTARGRSNDDRSNGFDEFHLDENDLPELCQMELDSKTFTANLTPSLNRLRRDTLRLVDALKRAPDERLSESSKAKIHEILADGLDALKINRRDDKSYGASLENGFPTTAEDPRVSDTEDAEALSALSDKWDFIDKYLIPNFNGAVKARKEENQRRPSLAGDTNSAADDGVDSFDRFRAANESIEMMRPSTSTRGHDRCHDDFRESYRADPSFAVRCSSSSSLTAPRPADVLEIPKNFGSCEEENASENPTPTGGFSPEIREPPYRLRRRPKATDHYFAPYARRAPVRKKPNRAGNNGDNVLFVCNGKRRNKKIVRYKFHSETTAVDPREFIKTVCPEIDCGPSAAVDISSLKSRKVTKPCACGIFPSQVPASWSDALHGSLHRNLHKLRFNVPTAVRAVTSVNDNGFLYDVVQIDADCEDGNLRPALKDIQDFIGIEVDFPRGKNYSSNRSVFLAAIGTKVIGYLEVESLKKAGVFLNDQFSGNVIDVKFGVTKLWVMVKYRKSGVATRLLNHFSGKKNLKAGDVAFAHHGNHGMSFIQKYFGSNSALFY